MSLSLLAAIAVPLCLAPWATHRLYEQVARQKTVAIAVDNAGIALGRAGRAVLEKWRRTSSQLEAAETVHHVLHLCARAPGPQAAACAAEDQAWERLWEARLLWLEGESRLHWSRAAIEARQAATGLGVSVAVEGFPPVPPVEREACPICGVRFKIRFADSPAPLIRSIGEAPDEGARVQWERSPNWNYRMLEAFGESIRIPTL